MRISTLHAGQSARQSFAVWHRMYFHVVWTTRDREPLIDAGIAHFLGRFLRHVAGQERALVLEMGLVSTHVHLLIRLHPTTALPKLMQRLKGGSAAIANREHHAAHGRELRWDRGYAITSVGPRALERVRQYVRDQQVRHPEAAIAGWLGDTPSPDWGGVDEWSGPSRVEMRR